MTFKPYLASALLAIIIDAIGFVLLGFVLSVAGVKCDLIVLAIGVMALFQGVAICIDYLQRRRFLRQLHACADEVDHPPWALELVDRPEYSAGQVAYDALAAVSKAANDEVAGVRRQLTEYRDYIETWVHEAKSPLAAAHLTIENMVAEGCDMARAETLSQELDRVESYINQALFYARSETLDRDYLIRKQRLSDMVAASLKANARQLIGAHVAPVREHLDYEVFADEKWVEFVIGQLIQNSIKYARPEGATISFTGALANEGSADECVELTVSDNGCGVQESELPRVFDKGFTGSNGRTGKRSTGLGLYLVKRLCDKMGVGVSARSVMGSSFSVTLSFPTNKFRYFE